MLASIFRHLRRIVITLLLIGFAGATLVRLGPGFGTDEREMDPRLNQQSRAAIEAEHAGERNIFSFYAAYLGGLLHGDLGFSRSLNRPVTELLRERLPPTLWSLTVGAGGGVALGLLLAAGSVFFRTPAYDMLSGATACVLVSIPAAALALGFLWWGVNGRWVIALIVAPQVYRYARNLFHSAVASQHVVTARAKGLSQWRILIAHVIAPVLPQLLALAGIAVSLAFAASIPIEAICDIPGIGQLAWNATLSRDLPLLVSVTMLAGVITLVANSFADILLRQAAFGSSRNTTCS